MSNSNKNDSSKTNLEETSNLNSESLPSQKSKQPSIITEWFRLFRDILLIFTLLLLFGVFIAQPVVVDGTSMMPNLKKGERLLVNKLVYYKYPVLQRGDVVVFWSPKDPETTYVKRIIGLPGETIEIIKGVVYLNGKVLNEPYLDQNYNTSLLDLSPKRIDDYHYFVMGDNRDYSSDSRYWGDVPEKLIYGKAFFRFWQPSAIGTIPNGNSSIAE